MNDDRNTVWSLIEAPPTVADRVACLSRARHRARRCGPEGGYRGAGASLPRRAAPRHRDRAVRGHIQAAEWHPVMRELLEDISRDRALQGFSPNETAVFVFSLKEPLFALLRRELGADADRLASETWVASRLIDNLGLYTMECYARTREEVITRQQQELLELSTPVVALWDGILALPLIRHPRWCAHADRHGEPAGAHRRLRVRRSPSSTSPACPRLIRWWHSTAIKTVSAARLMGADCILSGIRPQIAQTIVCISVWSSMWCPRRPWPMRSRWRCAAPARS